MYTTALFDLDGVILDTEPQYTVLWDQIGEEYYPELKHFHIASKVKPWFRFSKCILEITMRFNVQ